MTELTSKTLIIRFSSVGDIVLSSLLIRAFRTHAPAAQLDYLVRHEYADLVRYHPGLTRVIEFPQKGSFADLRALRRRVHAGQYSLVIDIHDSLRSRFITAGMPHVVRVNKRKLARFLLVRCGWDVYPILGGAPSVAQRYLEPVAHLGIVDDGKGLDFHIPDESTHAAAAILQHEQVSPTSLLIGVSPTARHATKMWLPERFAESAIALARLTGATVVLFGAANERAHAETVARTIRATAPDVGVVNLSGTLSLTETAAVMDRCTLVLTNDSGLMHVAAARKRPVVAVFGSTTTQLGFFPFGTRAVVVETNLGCRPCSHIGRDTCPKTHFRCMRDVTTDQVISAATHLLQGDPHAARP